MTLAFFLLFQQPSPPDSRIDDICFSPTANCLRLIRKEIDLARATVLVQAYSFTSDEIADALVRANKRGVSVEVIVDGARARERSGEATRLAKVGIVVLLDGEHQIAHNKIIIIDSRIVVTGSLNFTNEAARRNAENTLILRDEYIASIYAQNYHQHRKHSQTLKK